MPPRLPGTRQATALRDAPRVTHAFFTREGGVSAGVYASLNCGLGSHDSAEAVRENRARVAGALGVAADRMITAYQVHGTDVLEITSSGQGITSSGRGASADARPGDRPRADAIVCTVPGIAVGVLTADCAPILLADPDAGVVAAVHAGWRGALDGVAEAAVAAMTRHGARPERTVAAVGPCIGFASYEVGPEFPAPFLARSPDDRRYFAAAAREGHFRFDLAGYVAARVAASGVGTVETVDADTRAEAAHFFSYRQACLDGEPDYGRQISAIVRHD
jgi:YfiH family protein